MFINDIPLLIYSLNDLLNIPSLLIVYPLKKFTEKISNYFENLNY